MNRTREALQFISAQDREMWVRIGMACKAEHGAAAFEIWDEWSRTADNYNPGAARAVWRSIKEGGGITGGTLYHEAAANGWRDTSGEKPSPEMIAEIRRKSEERQKREADKSILAHKQAARRAGWILHQCELDQHAYLDKKGFREATGMVWNRAEGENILVIPMRIGRDIVGCQMIDRDGKKKFLSGQQSAGAEYLIDSGGRDFYVEGYASGLSLREVLNSLKIRYKIHVCFSAGNLAKIARGGGIVIADNDESGAGERAAIATGLPYWMSDETGEDINDAHQRLGVFRMAQEMRKWLTGK